MVVWNKNYKEFQGIMTEKYKITIIRERYQLSDNEAKTLRTAYTVHKNHTSNRLDRLGNVIEFLLTLEQWVDIWMQSGKLDERGCRTGQYVMSRYNDIGNYEMNNVFIQLHSKNAVEGNKGRERIVTDAAKKNMSNARSSKPTSSKRLAAIRKANTARIGKSPNQLVEFKGIKFESIQSAVRATGFTKYKLMHHPLFTKIE